MAAADSPAGLKRSLKPMQKKSSWLLWILAVSLPAASIYMHANQSLASDLQRVSCTTWHPDRMTDMEQRMQPYTVMVPEQCVKTIVIQSPRLISEVRNIENRVKVPVIKTIEKNYTVLVPKRVEKTVSRTVRVPWIEEIQESYRVRVPVIEEVTKMRMVIKRVPVQTTQSVTYRSGSWETVEKQIVIKQLAPDSSNSLARHFDEQLTVQQRSWVPRTITREVPVTMWRCEQKEVPFTVRRKIYRQEERTRTRQVRRWREEKRTHSVWVTKRVPETRTRTVRLKSWEWETQLKQTTVHRQVPEICTEEVCYTVMVPKKRQHQNSVTALNACATDELYDASINHSKQLGHRPSAVVPCGVTTPTTVTTRRMLTQPGWRFIRCRRPFRHQRRLRQWRRLCR